MKKHKRKLTKAEQDQLIREALQLAFRIETAELLRNYSTAPSSPDFDERLRALLEQECIKMQQQAQENLPPVPQAPPRRRRIALRYLVATILLVAALACGTVLACPAIRQRIVHLNKKEDPAHGNVHYTAAVEGQERRAFDLVEYYTLTDIPADFTLYVSRELPDYVGRIWVKSDSEPGAETVISFDQIPLNSLYILSTEGCTEETVILRGHEATYYHKPGLESLVWTTDDCMYVIGYWGPDTQGLDIFALEASMVKCGEP